MEELPPAQELLAQKLESEQQELELWCLIVGIVGTAFPVIINKSDRVWELQKTIKNEAVEIFGTYNAAQLRVYLAKNDNDEWLTASEVAKIENGDTETAKRLLDRGHLASMSQLTAIFRNFDANVVHILVRAPPTTTEMEVDAKIAGKRKRSEEPVGNAETISVSADEVDNLFDVLGQKKEPEQNLIVTSSISDFFRGYGEFPSAYFVRTEERMLWRLVLRLLSKRDKQVSIVGSSGVGKSCFLMLIAFYLALVEKCKVLWVRRMDHLSGFSSVIYLNGDNNTCIKKSKLEDAKVSLLLKNSELRGALVCVDGYSQVALKCHFSLFPHQLIASTREAGYISHELEYEVVLPAWRFDDLLHYSEATLHEWKNQPSQEDLNQKDLCDRATEQYFYSGGNLRDYCRDCKDVKADLDGICEYIHNAQPFFHQQGSHWSTFEHRIRRHYIVDRNDEEHFRLASFWRLEIDSGYVLRRIGRYMDIETQISLFRVAQNLQAGFQDSVFNQCFHGAVRHSTKEKPLQMINVVINSDPSCSNQRYDRLILHGPLGVCEGNTEEECYEALSGYFNGAYCHFSNVNFSFIEAVVICKGVLRGSKLKETVVAMISPINSSQRSFKSKLWVNLNKALDRNTRVLISLPRVFVVVGPDTSTCKKFTLVDMPSPQEYMVCCYDPLKQFQMSSTGGIANEGFASSR